MDPINSIASGQGTPGQLPGTQAAASEKEMFLKLLVAQMRNQDPMNPLQGSEFSAQLAQFSSLEQLQNMSSMIESSIEADMLMARSINNTLAATIVGKSVKAVSNQVQFDGDNPVEIAFDLASRASNVTVDIMGENGNLIRTLTVSDEEAGSGSVSWDGLDQKGNEVPAGLYYSSISATSPGGMQVQAQPLVIGHVEGIRFVNGNPVLLVGGREIPFGSVLEILEGNSNQGNPSSNWLSRMINLDRP